MNANNKSTKPLSCELTDYVTQFFCDCQERKLNGNHMLLDIVARRILKRFTDQTKFWDNMINFSFENTPTYLEPPLHSFCVPTLHVLIYSLHSAQIFFQH